MVLGGKDLKTSEMFFRKSLIEMNSRENGLRARSDSNSEFMISRGDSK
jgi:hypothetical protein